MVEVSCEIALRWLLLELTDDECRQDGQVALLDQK